MNIAIFILYIFVVFAIVLLLYLGYSYGTKITAVKTTKAAAPSNCTITDAQSIDISSLPCCVVGGITTGSRYVESLDMVVSPTPTPYLSVCKGFCPDSYAGGVCGNTSYGEISAFNDCVNRLKPNNCLGVAMPVAHVGAVPYYAVSATNITCQTTNICL